MCWIKVLGSPVVTLTEGLISEVSMLISEVNLDGMWEHCVAET